MAIKNHDIDLTSAKTDLAALTKLIEELDGTEVRTDRQDQNRPAVASVTRDLLYVQHLCDAVKVAVADEYWIIRGA